MKKILLLLASISFFLGFVFFSYLVHKDAFVQLDFDTTVRLQDNLPRSVDEPFSALTETGNFEVSLVLLIGVLGISFFFSKSILSFGFNLIRAGAVIGLFGFMHVIELFGKTFVSHPPPPEFMLRIERLFEFPQFYVRSEFSYPSGHAARTAFLSAFLFVIVLYSMRLKMIYKIIFVLGILCFDILMFVSRVYLGEHWTTDVIGGALIGYSFGLTGAFFYTFPTRSIRKQGPEKTS